MSNGNQLKEQWQQRIQSWRQTSLSQAQWCKQNNVKPSQFWYWRKKLEGSSTSLKKDKTVSSFVPVALAPEPKTPSTEATPLSISLPGGVTVSGIDHSNLALVRQLVGLLR